MRITTLRPGLLVALSTEVRGGVTYERTDLTPEHDTDDGARVAEWQTRKRVEDAAEHARAVQVRGKCRSLITGVCARSDFGLLCPIDREGRLLAAIEEAREVARQFNATASRSEVTVYVLTGRVEQSDVEAQRAISREIRDLVESMQAGIAAADPEKIREAAGRARDLGAMLTPEAQAKVTGAVEQARKAARDLVRRVEKSGELAATVIAECATDALEAARFAFLDLDAPAPVVEIPIVAPSLDLLAPEPATIEAQKTRSGAEIEF